MGSTYFSKRIFKLARHCLGGRNRTERPKTFKSEESANKWAESQGIKEYSLENLKTEGNSSKKIRVVVN
jgi:hypothetical protein